MPWHDDLSEIAFENVARSLGPCDGIYVCPAERVEIERGTHCVGTVVTLSFLFTIVIFPSDLHSSHHLRNHVYSQCYYVHGVMAGEERSAGSQFFFTND